jgi:hypothetical protein
MIHSATGGETVTGGRLTVTSDTERAAVPSSVRYGGVGAPPNPTILVPIRYPLTTRSIRTLEYASQLADRCDVNELTVLHIDLLQQMRFTTPEEISEAITPVIPDQSVSVYVNRSFLIEEAILEEAESIEADIVVLGKCQKALWRRCLNRLVGNDPDIVSFLCTHTGAEIVVVE